MDSHQRKMTFGLKNMIAAISWVPKGVSRSIPAVAETPSKEEIKEILNSRTFERRDVSYRPPGTQINLLNEVNICLPEKSFGLIFGRSGSGKTTLLQLIAGLTKPTSRSIYIQRYDNDGKPNQSPEQLTPERVEYFITDNVLDEVTFGWPRQRGDLQLKELLVSRLQRAIISVQIPNLLILDEPLAGLGMNGHTPHQNFQWLSCENCLQKFKLPEPVLCIDGILQVKLLGRVQRQELDGLFYICQDDELG
ncbi:unnamed protein product [Camellia sinensis]